MMNSEEMCVKTKSEKQEILDFFLQDVVRSKPKLEYGTTPYDIENPQLDNTFKMFHDQPEETPSKIEEFGQRDISKEYNTFDQLENKYKKRVESTGYSGLLKETYVPGSKGNFIKSSLNEKSKLKGTPYGYIIAHNGYM